MTRDAEAAARRPGTVHPHLARERALKVLFQADVRGEDPRVLLDRIDTTRGALSLLDELEPDEEQVAGDEALQAELTRRARMPLDDYTRTLVAGVATHRWTIDRVLGEVARRWTVERMPVVDRNLLRLAVYELAGQDTPPAVVIDEAVSFAGGFAGERARPFVNGVLETVRRRVEAGELVLDDDAPEEPPTAHVADASPDDPPVAATREELSVERDEDVPAGRDAPTAADAGAWDAALDLLADLDDLDGVDDLEGLDPEPADAAAADDTAPSEDDALAHAEPLALFDDEDEVADEG